MNIALSFVMIIMATIPLMLGFSIIYLDDMRQRHNRYFILLCIGSSVWSACYASLGVCKSIRVAMVIRGVLSASVMLTVSVGLMLVMIWMSYEDWWRRRISVCLVCVALIVYPFTLDKKLVSFVQTQYGLYYTYLPSPARTVVILYVVGLILSAILLLLHGMKYSNRKRQRIMVYTILECIFMCIVALSFNIFLPAHGVPAFPASGFAQFFSVVFVYRISTKYNVSRITVRNVSEYIYSAVNTPILIFGEEGRMQLANNSACTFFGLSLEQLMQKKLKDLFFITKEGKAPKKDGETASNPASLSAQCLINGAKCDLSINEICDRYQEKLGEIILIYDMTDKMNMIQELNESRKEAVRANEAKSAFLANMSHEIRTPMNAIIGMSEIALNHELPEDIQSELRSIRNAGTGLLSIINDILDFSKIESGNFKIIEAEYSLEEVVTDVVRLLSVRLRQKKVFFMVNVDPKIPKKLIGDDIRIRQIFMNIVGNAIKFTKHGYIHIRITSIFYEENQMTLQVEVMDTGIGIREEEICKLFDKFTQADSKRNRHITGTGLGLAISKNLVEQMGGRIEVESIYEVGSVFTFTIKQRIEDDSKLQVMGEEEYKIVIFEEDERLIESFTETLRGLGIVCVVCTRIQELMQMGEFSYLCIRNELLQKLPESTKKIIPREKSILLMNIAEYDQPVEEGQTRVFLPLFYYQMISILNHQKIQEIQTRQEDTRKSPIAMPEAKVLIVDDNATNLEVAKGLMAPYQLNIDTALSGLDALVQVQKKKYDLIFMDHRMPGLDGMDTTKKIREMDGEYKTVPIVVLTANLVSSTREEFLQEGFSDYLTKPIDAMELQRILKQWIWDKKVLEQSSIQEEITGIQMKGKIDELGGDLAVYLHILETYYNDLKMRRKNLQMFFHCNDFNNFEICVHAMKSASYGVGANKLGKMAERLEQACNKREYTWLNANFGAFIEETETMIFAVEQYLRKQNRNDTAEKKGDREEIPRKELEEIRCACVEMEYPKIEELLKQCRAYSYPEEEEKLLEQLEGAYNNFEYDRLFELLTEI